MTELQAIQATLNYMKENIEGYNTGLKADDIATFTFYDTIITSDTRISSVVSEVIEWGRNNSLGNTPAINGITWGGVEDKIKREASRDTVGHWLYRNHFYEKVNLP